MTKPIDIQEFAERVERLCDFLLSRVERTGSNDLKVIEDLKEDAANLHFNHTDELTGLYDYMNGVPNEPSS